MPSSLLLLSSSLLSYFVMLIHVSGNILANALFAILDCTVHICVVVRARSCMFLVHNMKQMIIFEVGIIFSFDEARN